MFPEIPLKCYSVPRSFLTPALANWVLCLPTGVNSLARKIGDMHKSVVEGCKDVADTKYIFSFSHLRAEADDLFFLLFFLPARCHFCTSSPLCILDPETPR